MAFAQVVGAIEEAVVGTAKAATKTAKRRGRNIAKAQKQVARGEAVKAEAAAKKAESGIIDGFDDPNYRSPSMEASGGVDELGEQMGRAREKAAFHRQFPGTEPIETRPAPTPAAPAVPSAPSGAGKSVESLMFKKAANASKGEAYLYDTTNKQLAADLNSMNNASARKKMGEAYNINNHEAMTDTQFKAALQAHHGKAIKEGPNMMHHMMGHKVPQKAAGLLVTAGVVNALSGSKGQQSNAQLYGQAPMPGM